MKNKHSAVKVITILTLMTLLLALNCGKSKITYSCDFKAPNPAWEPLGMTVDETGNIYITDRVICSVHKFNDEFIYKGSIGEIGKPVGKLMVPLSVAVDDRNRVWVSDFGNASISCYSQDGHLIWSRGNNLYKEGNNKPVKKEDRFPLQMAEGITYCKDALYIADSEANAIFKVNERAEVEVIETKWTLLHPEDICNTPDGLIVADTGNERLILPDGTIMKVNTETGSTLIPERVDVRGDMVLIMGEASSSNQKSKPTPYIVILNDEYHKVCEKALDPEEIGDAIFVDDRTILVSYPKMHRVVVYTLD